MRPLYRVTLMPIACALLGGACGGSGSSDFDGDGYPDDVDCAPDDPAINPGAEEQCDGIDNDCDGELLPEERDDDGDGWNECGDGDCDDANPAVYPGAEQICDGVEDNDCDGVPDAGEVDGDGDTVTPCDGDCDDGDPEVHPGAAEVCNGVDDDCDGDTDENADLDGDGFSLCDGDCDDGDPEINPWAAELCGDGVDQDCDGSTDDSCVTCDLVLSPGGVATTPLQDAMDESDRDTVICLEPGTYAENVDFGGTALRVVGTAGPTMTVITAVDTGPVVRAASEEPSGTVLEGVTVRGGSASNGAGVHVENADLTLRRVVIEGNTATGRGGGVYVGDATAVLHQVIVRDNEAAIAGGGVYVTGQMGGTTAFTAEASSVVDNRITGSVGTGGGGIAVSAATLVLDGVIVAGNGAPDFGGGLDLSSAEASLSNVIIADNDAANSGGGIRLTGGELTMVQGALLANRASNGGGLAVLTAGSPLLEQVVIVGNEAQTVGGGIYGSNYSTTAVTGGIVAFNEAGDGSAGVAGDGINGTDVTFEGCTIHGNLPQDVIDVSDPFASGDNLADDPLLTDISAADPLDWDLHLSVDSPCIDRGPTGCADVDDTICDQGLYGGSLGTTWDRDGDGWPEWWQPGEYDGESYPEEGWDCDDRAAGRTPDSGC